MTRTPRRWQALLAAIVLCPLLLGGWRMWQGGEATLVQLIFLTQAQSPFADSAAATFMQPGNSGGNCTWLIGGTFNIPANSTTITLATGSLAGVRAGDTLGNINSDFPAGDAIQSISGTTITLASATLNSSADNGQNVYDTPAYPAQWTWAPASITNQPQGAQNAFGTVLATGNTTNGSTSLSSLAAVSGSPYPVTAIAAGDQVYGPGVPAGDTVQSVSGTTATLVTAADGNAGSGLQYLFSPLAPSIAQYHASGTATANFTGSISGTTLNVTSTPSTALATGDLLTAAPTPLANATTITKCPGGGTGNCGAVTGAYTVSVSQTIASETISAFAVAATYTNFSAAFPRDSGSQTWQPGDVFVVAPAIYTDIDNQALNDIYVGPSQIGDVCFQNATLTYQSATVTCTSVSGTPQIGDYVRETDVADGGVYFPLDTQITGISGNTITLSEKYVGPNNSAAILSFDRAFSGTIWGATVNDGNGVPTRAVLENLNAPSPWGGNAGQDGFILVGTDGERGVVGNVTIGNLDLNIPSTLTHISPTSGLVDVTGPFGGTVTFQDMRIEGGIYATMPGDQGGMNGLLGGDEHVTQTLTISGTPTAGQTTSLAFYCNSQYPGLCQLHETSNLQGVSVGTVSYTAAAGNTATDVAAGLVKAFVTLAQGGGVTPLASGFTITASGNVLTLIYEGAFETSAIYPSTTDGALALAVANVGSVAGYTSTGTLNLLNLELAYNGGSEGPHHQIYAGLMPNATLNFENSYIHNTYWGHDFKSRMGTNNIIANYLDGGETAYATFGGGEGADIDLPCGGVATIKDNILVKSFSGGTTAASVGAGNGHQVNYREEYPNACLTEAVGPLTIQNDTFALFSATYDGYTYNYPLAIAGPDWYHNSSNFFTCTGAVIFAGDNIVEVPTANVTGACSLSAGNPTWVEDTTNSATIPALTWLGYPGISNAGRTCPASYTCFFMSANATAASVAGGDNLTLVNTYNAMPNDQGWPLVAANSWSIKDNLVAGACPDTGQIEQAGPNAGMRLNNFGWRGTQPSNSGGSVGVVVTQALSELSQAFSPTPKYAVAGDTGIIGTNAYAHNAIGGLTRALQTLGAVD